MEGERQRQSNGPRGWMQNKDADGGLGVVVSHWSEIYPRHILRYH